MDNITFDAIKEYIKENYRGGLLPVKTLANYFKVLPDNERLLEVLDAMGTLSLATLLPQYEGNAIVFDSVFLSEVLTNDAEEEFLELVENMMDGEDLTQL